MDSVNQQKILGYFIEEAKEHLETLERGILELSSVVKDAERVNELFRVAHSLKGGAAMLGYTSIQKTAHRLEDFFKIIKENPIPVDQTLESLLLAAYDLLRDLIEQLQSPFGLQPDEAAAIVQRGEPTFIQLQDYLNKFLVHGVKAVEDEDMLLIETAANLASQMRTLLKQMLQIFKQQATPHNRQELQQLCTQLAQLAPREQGWQALTKMAQTAIANPKHSFPTLAPILIKDLKRGSDFIELGQGNQILPSRGLEQLVAAPLPQVLIALEPQAVANTLLQLFNQQQLSQVIQLLELRKS